MRVAHVKLLRKSLVALIIVVLCAVGFNYVQTWRHRARIVRQATRILSTDMLRSADTIEYSEQENGVVHFELRAERLLETRQGINLLEGIEASDKNPDGTTRNHIRSLKAEYDRDGRKAFFFGDVRIEIGQGAEIRTNSLRYDLDKNTGETEEKIELYSNQVHGTAQGVRYEHAGKELNLLRDVDFTLVRSVRTRDGTTRTETVRGQSERGYYSDSRQTIRWLGNARLESGTALLSGDDIEATLSQDKKKITSLICRGNSSYQSKDTVAARTLRGDTMNFGINEGSGTLERIDVHGQATFSTKGNNSAEQILGGSEIRMELDPVGQLPRNIQARENVQFVARRESDETLLQGDNLEAGFGPAKSILENMHVWGHARMKTRSSPDSSGDQLSAEDLRMIFREVNSRSVLARLDAEQSVKWESAAPGRDKNKGNEQGRTLTSSRLRMLYSESGDYLESGSATGDVELAGIPTSSSTGMEIRRLKADTVRFRFYPGDNKPKSFDGEGNVEVFYHKPPEPDGSATDQEFHTSSTNMHAAFSESDGEVESLSQWGNFRYEDRFRTATAGRSDFSAEKDTLVLSESPRISDSNGWTTGDLVTYDRRQKILLVQQHVRSVLKPKEGGDAAIAGSSRSSGSPSVVTAGEMQYWTETAKVRYTDKVQMMSETSQMQADAMEIYDSGDRIEAQGDVRHLLSRSESERDGSKVAQKPAQAGKAAMKNGAKRSPILIRSKELRYVKGDNCVHYAGDVTLQSEELWMSADNMDAVIESGGRRIETAAARGKVYIRQAGREVRGRMADYFLTPGKLVVTGESAEISDPTKGRSAARRLTFFTTDDRILLEKQ